MKIITRAEWGFDGWLDPKNPPSRITEANRTAFFTHYQGGPTRYRTGFGVPRSIHAMHKANGWKGIGYGHIVDNDGTIYEGRGFTLSGSHCPGWNTAGYSAQGHIGVGEKPSPAMLASLRWLYDEACRRSGRTLSKKGHRDGTATSCPGDVLYAWVKAGMPANKPTEPPTAAPAPEEDDGMKLTDKVPVLDPATGKTVEIAYRWLLQRNDWVYHETLRQKATLDAIAAKLLSPDEIAAAAERGTQAALDARISGAEVTLEVQP